jgi:hypothetical protein
MMKKFFGSCAIALVLVAFAAGGAWATAGIDDDTTVAANDFDEVVIAQGLTSATAGLTKDFELGDVGTDADPDRFITGGATRDFYYMADLGLNLDWTMKFELTNGTFDNTTLALMYNEATNGNDLNTDGDTVDLIEVGQLISGGYGLSYVTFIITGGSDLPASSILTISSSDTAETSIRVVTTSTSSSVYMACTQVKTDGGTDIDAAECSNEEIIEFETQFTMALGIAATSVIDVDAARKNFVDETSGGADSEVVGNEDSELTQSSATMALYNDIDSSIDDPYVCDALDFLSFTVTPSTDFSGVATSGVSYNTDDDTTIDAGESFTIGSSTATHTITLNEAGADSGNNIVAVQGDTDTKKLVITVNGTTALDTRTFNVEVDLTLADGTGTFLSGKALVISTLSHTWGINGFQATMPYAYWADIQKTFVKFYNRSSVDAEVFVTVKNADGTGAEELTLATIPAGQVGQYNAQAIIAAATSLAEGQAFTMTFTITAPETQVHGTAFFNLVGSGTRKIELEKHTTVTLEDIMAAIAP